MKIGISGAGGFVGSHLARALSRVHEVRRLARNEASRLQGFEASSGAPSGRSLEASRPRSLDLLIHAAGLVGGAHPREEYFAANVDNAVAVARAAVAMGAKRCILLSTGAAHEPSGPYAESKKAGEDAVRAILPTQILRLYFPYGPGQQGERLIPRLIARIRAGETVTEGPRMNPIYIDDLVAIIEALLEIDAELFADAGGPEIVSIREIAEIIGAILNVEPVILPATAPSRDWIADIEPIVAIARVRPAVAMREGLRRVIASL
jgi:nucleoside-diphosphate-sugar epimerase